MVKDAKTISYNVEITEKGFVQVSSEVTKLNKAFSSVGESSKNMSLAIKTVVKDVRANTEAHGRTVNVMNAEISGLEQLRDSYGKSNKLYRQVQSRINAVIAEKKALTDVSSKEVKQEKTLLQQISALNDGRKRTVDVIQQEISLRRQMQSSTSTNRKEFLKEEIEIKKLERGLNSIAKSQSRVIKSSVKMGTATKSLNKKLGNTSSATGSASGAVVELGRTVSDSNYGFPAMANNFQQFATQMSFLVQESKGVKGAFVQLGKAMTGAGGILLLISIAISIFERFALKAREAKNEVKDLNGELAKRKGVLDNIKNLADIVRTSTDNIGLQELALKDLKEKGYDPLIGTLEDFIKLKEQEMIFEIAMEEFSKSKLEYLTKEEEIRTKIKEAQAKLSGDIEPETTISGTAGLQVVVKSASQIRSELEAELANLETSLAVNGVNIATVNERIRQSYIDLAKGVKNNPFTKSITGGGEEIIKGSIADFEQQISVLEKRQQQATNNIAFNQIQDEIDALLVKIDEIKSDGDDGVDRGKVESLDFDPTKTNEQVIKDKLQGLRDELQSKNEIRQQEFESIFEFEKRKKALNDQALADSQANARALAFMEEKKRHDRLATLGALASATAAASTLFAEGTAENKAFGIASATIDTYIGANQVWKDETLPTIAKIPAVASIILSGLANVKKIASVEIPNKGASGGSTASPSIQAPDFNIVGASDQSQLAQTISQAEQQPVQAFVVAEDVTSAQQLDRNIIQGASLG